MLYTLKRERKYSCDTIRIEAYSYHFENKCHQFVYSVFINDTTKKYCFEKVDSWFVETAPKKDMVDIDTINSIKEQIKSYKRVYDYNDMYHD